MSEQNQNNDQQLVLLDDSDKKKAVLMANDEAEGLLAVPGIEEGVNHNPMAINADPVVLRLTIKVAVMKAYIHHQRPAKASDLTILIDDLKAEILRAFKSIRLKEIGLAIHKSAMGDYGKVYNLSMAFFREGINQYMNSEKRVEEVKKMLAGGSAQLLLEAPKQSAEEIEKDNKQRIYSAYEFYKKKAYFYDYANCIFNSLADYGVLVFSDEDKDEFWKQAKRNVYKELTTPTNNPEKRSENRRIIEELKHNKEHPRFYREAKRVALNKFFYDCKEMDVELSELIEA